MRSCYDWNALKISMQFFTNKINLLNNYCTLAVQVFELYYEILSCFLVRTFI